MTTAALATGNTALVKPSTQTRGIAQAMCDILWQAGVPEDVLQFRARRGPRPSATCWCAIPAWP